MKLNFSPLFIGECSSTLPGHLYSVGVNHFSPLFIGECSSTRGRLDSEAEVSRFRSPLHRGMLFNLSMYGVRPKNIQTFQSPLHRGMLFNARATSVRTISSFD